MNIIYANDRVRKQCTSLKAATKLFGGNSMLAISLLSRVNAIEQASDIKDIIVNKPFRFHNLKGDRKGYFAIDVKTIRDKWRVILRPLDEDGKSFEPCRIDEIAMIVRTVEIKEVSAHYE